MASAYLYLANLTHVLSGPSRTQSPTGMRFWGTWFPAPVRSSNPSVVTHSSPVSHGHCSAALAVVLLFVTQVLTKDLIVKDPLQRGHHFKEGDVQEAGGPLGRVHPLLF